MSVHDDLNLYLRARVPMIVLVTVEEQRALEVLNEVRVGRDASAKSDLVMWDVARGLVSRDGRPMPTAATPDAALDKIAELTRDNPNRKDLYVLKDFHEFWHKSPAVKRKLRNLAHSLVSTYASLVVTTYSPDVPAELGDDVVVLDMPLPGLWELRQDLDELIRQTRVECDLTHHGRWRLAQAALGLTATQARRAFSKAIVRDKVLDELDIPAVLEEKKAVIRSSQALEYYSSEETLDDVGGLELLKEWLTLRESAFGEEAAKFGLPAPKGMWR
ncbi:hypothetical protein [Actinomadura sp. CNU-125]|uniref:hypothetical protein n=1 Tax=Actinomadura sp. CNU-125 TaxID=1904961 RepID=UPI000A4F570E|nr:hypothetical protein [Actinomadura sp. CNU-125]